MYKLWPNCIYGLCTNSTYKLCTNCMYELRTNCTYELCTNSMYGLCTKVSSASLIFSDKQRTAEMKYNLPHLPVMATVHDISRHLTYILIKGYIIITSLLRVSFIAEPSTAALSHRMPHPVTAAVANGKRNALYVRSYTYSLIYGHTSTIILVYVSKLVAIAKLKF